MLGYHFYHGLIRKYVVLFGQIFNDIYVDRKDKDGVTQRTFKIPVSYGPKERYLARFAQNPDLLREVSMVFPRMSFEITNIYYDPTRKLNTIGKIPSVQTGPSANTNVANMQYNPVAYNFDITLSIIARNTQDALQIVEQIAPYFTPQWTETLTLIEGLDINMDIPVILKTMQMVDTYAGNFESKEWIIWDLTFTLKGYLYGATRTKSLIKESIVNTYIPKGAKASSGVGITPAVTTVTVTPGMLANGSPTSNAALSVSADLISADDNYGFITDYEEDLQNG